MLLWLWGSCLSWGSCFSFFLDWLGSSCFSFLFGCGCLLFFGSYISCISYFSRFPGCRLLGFFEGLYFFGLQEGGLGVDVVLLFKIAEVVVEGAAFGE